MKKIVSIAMLACVLLAFSGCVQRTTYSQMRNPSHVGGNTTVVDDKPTSSRTLWFWQKEFWCPNK